MDGSMSPMSMEQHEMMERQMMMQQQQQQQAMMQQHDEVPSPPPPAPRGLFSLVVAHVVVCGGSTTRWAPAWMRRS